MRAPAPSAPAQISRRSGSHCETPASPRCISDLSDIVRRVRDGRLWLLRDQCSRSVKARRQAGGIQESGYSGNPSTRLSFMFYSVVRCSLRSKSVSAERVLRGQLPKTLQPLHLLLNSQSQAPSGQLGTNSGNAATARVDRSRADLSAASSESPIGTVTRTIAPSDRRNRTLSITV